MPEAFSKFIAIHPFWGLLLIVFMLLPIVGAILWVFLALFRRSIGSGPDDNDN